MRSPLSHSRDPDTSRRAAERAKPLLQRHRDAVLAAVRAHPHATATQLADVLHGHELFAEEHYRRRCQVAKRLSEMKGEGIVVDVPAGERERGWVAR